MTEAKTLTDAEIVAGLRSEDPQERHAALEALAGDEGGCLFIDITDDKIHTTFGGRVSGAQLLGQLIVTATQLGEQLGARLQWVQQEPPTGIIAPPHGFMS